MPVEVATPALKYSDAAEGVLFLKGTYTFWAPLRDHPPPKPSFQCPHQTKKGTDMLLSEFCIHLHTHQDLKLKCCRVMGQKLRYGRPCTHDLPGTHDWLAQPHIAFISSEFHWLSYAGTILEIWSELLLHWLDSPHGLHPSACASDIWTCPHTPTLTQFAQKGWQSTGLELRIPLLCLKFRGSGPEKKLEAPPQTKTTSGNIPPPPRFIPTIYTNQ